MNIKDVKAGESYAVHSSKSKWAYKHGSRVTVLEVGVEGSVRKYCGYSSGQYTEKFKGVRVRFEDAPPFSGYTHEHKELQEAGVEAVIRARYITETWEQYTKTIEARNVAKQAKDVRRSDNRARAQKVEEFFKKFDVSIHTGYGSSWNEYGMTQVSVSDLEKIMTLLDAHRDEAIDSLGDE